MIGFIVIEDSFPQQVAAVADAVNMIIRLRGVNGSARWYYDDDVDGSIEHGVRLEISDLSPEQAIDHMRSIWQLVVAQYEGQEVYLEING